MNKSISPTHSAKINTQYYTKENKLLYIKCCAIIGVCLVISVAVICKTVYDIAERKSYYLTELEKFNIIQTKKNRSYYLYND